MSKLSKIISKTTPDVLDVGGINDWQKGMFDPKKPAITPVAPLPDEDALAVARRRRLAATMQRSGRDSTIMSDSLGKLMKSRLVGGLTGLSGVTRTSGNSGKQYSGTILDDSLTAITGKRARQQRKDQNYQDLLGG